MDPVGQGVGEGGDARGVTDLVPVQIKDREGWERPLGHAALSARPW